MMFYESPYRLVKTLKQFADTFGGDRQVSVAREVSKVHEEHVRGTLNEVIAHFEEVEPKGEIVIVLAGNAEANETVLKSSGKAKDKREKTNEELLHEMLYGKKKD